MVQLEIVLVVHLDLDVVTARHLLVLVLVLFLVSLDTIISFSTPSHFHVLHSQLQLQLPFQRSLQLILKIQHRIQQTSQHSFLLRLHSVIRQVLHFHFIVILEHTLRPLEVEVGRGWMHFELVVVTVLFLVCMEALVVDL